jgi:hypothetical protein
LLGFTPFVRYAVLMGLGEPGGGHVQSLLVGAVLLLVSFLSVMLGIISDLIRTNRILLETTLEHSKRARFGTREPPRSPVIGLVERSTDWDGLPPEPRRGSPSVGIVSRA